MSDTPIFFPDTNCWRGETELLKVLEQELKLERCRLATTYIVVRECATADTIERSYAALERVLKLTNCWLRGRDEMLNGVVSYINNDWYDEITVEMLPYEANYTARDWNRYKEGLANTYFHDRKLKERQKEQWVLESTRIRDKFIAETNNLNFKTANLNEQELFDLLRKCFDPDSPEWGGIILDEILGDRGLEKTQIRELLLRMSQFPGLRLAYGHMLYSHFSHIAGRRIDESFVPDTLILLPISSSTVFITRDSNVLKSAEILRMRDYIKTPDEVIKYFRTG